MITMTAASGTANGRIDLFPDRPDCGDSILSKVVGFWVPQEKLEYPNLDYRVASFRVCGWDINVLSATPGANHFSYLGTQHRYCSFEFERCSLREES